MPTHDFLPGDIVNVKQHTTSPTLYPDCIYTVPASEGWVVHETPGRFRDKVLCLRLLPGAFDYQTLSTWPQNLELVQRGRGTFEFGRDIALSGRMAQDRRYQHWLGRLEQAIELMLKHGYQGYSNAATFLAVTYLNQEPAWHHTVHRIRRKDGTVNHNKAYNEFRRLGLKIDDWAYAAPIDTPDEFKGRRPPAVVRKLDVNWREVAAQFKKERNEQKSAA